MEFRYSVVDFSCLPCTRHQPASVKKWHAARTCTRVVNIKRFLVRTEMAPTEKKMKSNEFKGKGGNWKKSKNTAQNVKNKRKWIPDNKIFEGSVKEGKFY